jgi:hypothetical protein
MSQELIEFSDLIDERFEPTEIVMETDEFWESVLNLFI